MPTTRQQSKTTNRKSKKYDENSDDSNEDPDYNNESSDSDAHSRKKRVSLKRKRETTTTSSSSSSSSSTVKLSKLRFSSSSPNDEKTTKTSKRSSSSSSNSHSSKKHSSSPSLLFDEEDDILDPMITKSLYHRTTSNSNSNNNKKKRTTTMSPTNNSKLSNNTKMNQLILVSSQQSTQEDDVITILDNDKRRNNNSNNKNSDDDDDFDHFFDKSNKANKKMISGKNKRVDKDDDEDDISLMLDSKKNMKKNSISMMMTSREKLDRQMMNTSSTTTRHDKNVKKECTAIMSSHESWTEKYAPKITDDLLMNKDKQSAVESFFHAFTLRNVAVQKNVLILSGPPGAGKMSMVRAIIRSMGLGVKEFVHSDLENIEFNASSSHQDRSSGEKFVFRSYEPYESRLKMFDRFLQTTRFCALSGLGVTQSGDTCVHLVSELPMTHDNPKQKAELFNILRNNILTSNMRRNPIVIIHNVYDSPTALSCLYKSFPNEVMNAPNVELVKVNGFGKKNMKTILDRIISCESRVNTGGAYDFRTLNQTTAVKDIIEKSNGDLRHAINQLQFMSVKKVRKTTSKDVMNIGKMISNQFSGFQFAENDSTDFSVSDIKRSRNASLNTLEDSDLRDPVIDIYHASARVLYGKRDGSGQINFDLEHNVLHSVYANENSLVYYVHENLPSFCQDIDDYAKIVDGYSLGDTFCSSRLFETGSNSYNRAKINADYQGESMSIYNFLISCYSTLVHNKNNRAPNTKRSIYSPKLNEIFFKQRDFKAEIMANFANEVDHSIVDADALLQEIIPYQHLIFQLCLNRRDMVNGVRVPKSPEVRGDRTKRIRATPPHIQSLLKKIHNYPARNQPIQIQEAKVENDGMDLAEQVENIISLPVAPIKKESTATMEQEDFSVFDGDDIEEF